MNTRALTAENVEQGGSSQHATATSAQRQHHRQHFVAMRGGAGSPLAASAVTSKRGSGAQSPWQVLWTLTLPDLHLVILALVALTLAGQTSESPWIK